MIPKGWTQEPLCQVVQQDRKICYGIVQPGSFEPDGIPLIRGKDYSFGWATPGEMFRVSAEIDRPYRRSKVRPGDLLLTIVGAGTGNVAVVPEWLDGANITQTTARIAVDCRTHEPRYVRALLESRLGKNAVYRAIKGGAQPGLNIADIELSEFPYPPLSEQRRIAEILFTWDRAIEMVEALIANARAQKKALMQSLLTGKKRLPGFPGAWHSTSIAKMGKIVAGGTPDSTDPVYWDGDIAWATPTDITKLQTRHIAETERYITQLGLTNSAAKPLPAGTVVVCTRATVGALAIATVPMTTNQGFKNIVPNEGHDSDFIYYLLSENKKALVRAAGGSTFAEVSKADFEKLAFRVPNIAEQQAIVAILVCADDAFERLGAKLTALRKEKSALMQQLLTGKRRVKVDEREAA